MSNCASGDEAGNDQGEGDMAGSSAWFDWPPRYKR